MSQLITDMNEESNMSSLTCSLDENNILLIDLNAMLSTVDSVEDVDQLEETDEQHIVEGVDQLEENDDQYIANLNKKVQEILSLISEDLWSEKHYANAASIVEHPKIVRNLKLNIIYSFYLLHKICIIVCF